MAVLASGPSATSEDAQAAQAAGCAVVAVNASFRLLPTCDVVYMGDYLPVKEYHQEVRTTCPQAQLWTCNPLAAEQHQAHLVRALNEPGLGLGHIHMNGNSGFQAINFAFLAGAKHILLLGFDMKLGPNGEKRWHGEHPKHMVPWQQFGDWIHKSARLAADLAQHGVRVANCTPGSALTTFPMSTLQEELCRVQPS